MFLYNRQVYVYRIQELVPRTRVHVQDGKILSNSSRAESNSLFDIWSSLPVPN